MSKVVGNRFMDKQFDFLNDNDNITSALPTCSLDACEYNKTPAMNRFVRLEDSGDVDKEVAVENTDFDSSSVSRISHGFSFSEGKRKQGAAYSSADCVKSQLSFPCNQALLTNFEAALSDLPLKRMRRDVS